jgi:hypothetical protein
VNVYRVRVPACTWLTANVERYRYSRAQHVRAWRQAVVDACTAAGLPQGITPVRIVAEVRYAGSRAPVRDRLNLANTIKAIVDGLGPGKTITRPVKATGAKKTYRTAGYGFLPDDSDKHVLGTDWTLAPSGTGQAWVDLTITHEAEVLW